MALPTKLVVANLVKRSPAAAVIPVQAPLSSLVTAVFSPEGRKRRRPPFWGGGSAVLAGAVGEKKKEKASRGAL